MAKGKKGAERIRHTHVDKFSNKPEDEQRNDTESRERWLKQRGQVKVPSKAGRR